MMLIGRASQGQTQMLTRYGIILDENLTAQEKFNEVLKIGATAFELAEAEAETTSGSLKQMKNALGDIAEVIGQVFLPGMKSSAIAIKNWAENNNKKIAEVAQKIKTIFMDIVKYFKSDWKAGLQLGVDIALITMKGFGKSLVIIMKAALEEIGQLWETYLGSKFAEKMAQLAMKSPWFILLSKSKKKQFVEAMKLRSEVKMMQNRRNDMMGPPASMASELRGVAIQTGASIQNRLQDANIGTNMAMRNAAREALQWLNEADMIVGSIAQKTESIKAIPAFSDYEKLQAIRDIYSDLAGFELQFYEVQEKLIQQQGQTYLKGLGTEFDRLINK